MPVPAGGGPTTDLYTDVTTVKSTLGKITVDDRDDLIEQAIRSASRMIDRKTGRRFYADEAASARLFVMRGGSYTDGCEQGVLVDDISTLDGLVVESGGTGNWAALDTYDTGPDNALAYGRPITSLYGTTGWLPWSGRVRVTARWGWPAVPDEITQAAMMLAARLYRRKDSPQGVMGSSEWGAIRVSRLDPDVEALLTPFVMPVVA
jgi:hypothetical protein